MIVIVVIVIVTGGGETDSNPSLVFCLRLEFDKRTNTSRISEPQVKVNVEIYASPSLGEEGVKAGRQGEAPRQPLGGECGAIQDGKSGGVVLPSSECLCQESPASTTFG